MIDLELTHEERRLYEAALAQSRPVRVRLTILDRNERVIGGLTPDVVDGQVQVDADSDVVRSLQMTVYDPGGRLHYEPDSPSETALFFDRMVAVEREDYVPALGRWIACPVFWGPLMRFSREGPIVEIDAVGKEALALEPHIAWKGKRIRKNTRTTTAIRRIMGYAGETRFTIPSLRRKVRKGMSIGRHQEFWKKAKRLARSLDRQLFYDARGFLRLRQPPGNPIYLFTGGDEGVVTTIPQVAYDYDELRNVVEVQGATPRGKKKAVRGVKVAPAGNALSAQSLARNLKPRWIVEVLSDSDIKRASQARRRARRLLNKALRTSQVVAFECLPVPHLEEGDPVVINVTGERFEVDLTQFSIPLTADGTMTVGFLKRVRSERRG